MFGSTGAYANVGQRTPPPHTSQTPSVGSSSFRDTFADIGPALFLWTDQILQDRADLKKSGSYADLRLTSGPPSEKCSDACFASGRMVRLARMLWERCTTSSPPTATACRWPMLPKQWLTWWRHWQAPSWWTMIFRFKQHSK